MGSPIKDLTKRIDALNKLDAKVEQEIAAKKNAGFKDDPKYLSELREDIKKQKEICEQEKKLHEEKKANQADLKSKDQATQNAAKLKEASLKKQIRKLAKDNPELHNNPKKLAEPCIPCMKKKMEEQDPKKHFIKFDLKTGSGQYVTGISFALQLPDGNEVRLTTNKKTLEVTNIEPGQCKVPIEWEDGMNLENVMIVV